MFYSIWYLEHFSIFLYHLRQILPFPIISVVSTWQYLTQFCSIFFCSCSKFTYCLLNYLQQKLNWKKRPSSKQHHKKFSLLNIYYVAKFAFSSVHNLISLLLHAQVFFYFYNTRWICLLGLNWCHESPVHSKISVQQSRCYNLWVHMIPMILPHLETGQVFNNEVKLWTEKRADWTTI